MRAQDGKILDAQQNMKYAYEQIDEFVAVGALEPEVFLILHQNKFPFIGM